jgi:hypothetical protein
MNDDPEYQWIDKIRTPRASNEARQTLFLKLSGIIQRKIGLKALELGGNAVLGWGNFRISCHPFLPSIRGRCYDNNFLQYSAKNRRFSENNNYMIQILQKLAVF